MLVVRSRNWQGCFTFIQSPSLSLYNHFSRNAFSVMPRCLEMRTTSFLVYVGDMVLQQFAQSRQFNSFQTDLSAFKTRLSNSCGRFFSNLVKKLLMRLLLCLTNCLNERRLIVA